MNRRKGETLLLAPSLWKHSAPAPRSPLPGSWWEPPPHLIPKPFPLFLVGIASLFPPRPVAPCSGRSHRSSVCTQKNKEHGEVNPKVHSSPPDLPVPSPHAPASTFRIKPLGWAKRLFCTTSPITSPKRGTAAHRGCCGDINEHQRPPGFPSMTAASRRGESFTGHQLPGQPMMDCS